MIKQLITAIVGVGILVAACSEGEKVEELTIGNESPYPVRVEVTDADHAGWLRLAVIPQMSDVKVREVVDQGDLWVFRFNYADRYSETVDMSRADLEDAGWRVVVPDSFEDTLDELGVDPPL